VSGLPNKFDRKEITAQRSIPTDMITAFHPDADAGDVGRDIIKGWTT